MRTRDRKLTETSHEILETYPRGLHEDHVGVDVRMRCGPLALSTKRASHRQQSSQVGSSRFKRRHRVTSPIEHRNAGGHVLGVSVKGII